MSCRVAAATFPGQRESSFTGDKLMSTILTVDPSPSMRQMVTFTLKNAGYDVVEAVDGQDAWEKAGSRDFNLVLMDWNMPRMDGSSLTQKLRENPKFKITPILVLTTESSDQAKMVGRDAGATGWLVKPFDPAKLIEVIGRVISTPLRPTIKFRSGDIFVFSGGSGVVLPCGKALIISGQGGRGGYNVKKDLIPEDAVPGKPTMFEVSFALNAVVAAVSP